MTNATELTGLVLHDNSENKTAFEAASVAASNGSTSSSGNNSSSICNKRSFSYTVKWWFVFIAVIVFVVLLWSAVFLPNNGNSSSSSTQQQQQQQQQQHNIVDNRNHVYAAPSSTQSKYKQVQGIGFQIYTGGAPAFLDQDDYHHQYNDILNPECLGLASYGQVVGEEAPMLQCYIGLPDAEQDVQQRLDIMRDAVEQAYQKTTKDAETLKIFIAPEFYWRGIDGAYIFEQEAPNDPDICGPVCQLLQGLEGIVADERFQDWLFVFGTVIASDQIAQDDNDDYDYLFYNFAPMYKGYDPAKQQSHVGKRFIVPKRYVSSSDFLTPQRHLNASIYKELLGQELPGHDTTVRNPHDFNQKRYDNDMWLQYKDELNVLGYTMIEYDWFIMDGLSMTLEICFDHQMRTALNSWTGDAVTGRHTLIPSSSDAVGLEYVPMPPYQAQISLVSSAGMTATPESMALTNGGVIFVQDGLTNETNHMYWGMEGCELGLQFAGGTEAVQRRAFLSPTDVVFEHTAIGDMKRHDLYPKHEWEGKLEGLFSAKVYPPQVIVFDPIDIAEVAP